MNYELMLGLSIGVIFILLGKIAELSSQVVDAENIIKSMRGEIDLWRDSYNLLKLKDKSNR